MSIFDYRSFIKIKRSIFSRGILDTFFLVYWELVFFLRFHVKVRETIPLSQFSIKSRNISGGNPYESCNYYYYRQAIRKLRVDKNESVIIDFGSGKGNVLIMSVLAGFGKIIGVEFARELVEESEIIINNKLNVKKRNRIQIINCDVVDYKIPEEANVLFFFNPFTKEIFEKVKININSSHEKKPREIFIVYVNPMCEEIFANGKYEEIYRKRNKNRTDWVIYKMF